MIGDDTAARRREWAKVNRDLTPKARILLSSMAQYDFQIWRAAKELGYSPTAVKKWLRNANFQRAREMVMDEVWELIGECKASIIATTARVRDRCLQAEPMLDNTGQPTGEYRFDAHAVLKANELLAKWQKMTVDKVEHSGPDGGPIETKSQIQVEGMTDEQLRALSSIKIQGE